MFKLFLNGEFKAKFILVLYLLCALVNISAQCFDQKLLIWVSKPLLIPLLLIFFLLNVSNIHDRKVIGLITIALIAATSGDILLLFTDKPEIGEFFFLAGLASFFLTHVFYSFSFSMLAEQKVYLFPTRLTFPLLLFWLVFNFTFSIQLSGFMQIAVMLYSTIILIMIYFAWRLVSSLANIGSQWVWYGALVFLFSDTCIGINKFGQDLLIIPFVDALIMATYLAGQGLIVVGILCLITNRHKLQHR